MVFMTTSRCRDLQKASVAPPPSRVQSAHQGRRPHLSWSPNSQQPASRNQRVMSSAKFTQKPCTCRVPMKPKKSVSFPVTGTSLRKVTQPPLHIFPVTVQGTVYHMDVEALRKNLQLLSEEAGLGLPHYPRSKALGLITTTALNTPRLQYLCCTYILSRRDVISHVQVMRETGAIYKAQNLNIFLENIDYLQNLRLQAWTDRQKDLEEKRRERLSSMVTVFPKVGSWLVTSGVNTAS
ncbi:hypothetical protein MC885_014113 [Smutsia gigantea]|nr:hypothetical protein MC885_014113 [Smutsia gigantea]